MDSLINLYEFLTIMVPFLIAYLIFRLFYKKKNIEKEHRHFFYLIIFAFYIFGVFHFTGSGTLYDLMLYNLEFRGDQLNMIPFSDNNINTIAYGLNVVLFIPLGFLLPLIWSDFKAKYICIFGFSLSLLVELSQLLNNRSTDVDDLILNTIGAAVGYILFKLFAIITKRAEKPMTCCKCEPVVYVSIMFICRFLTFDVLGLAKLLYGF